MSEEKEIRLFRMKRQVFIPSIISLILSFYPDPDSDCEWTTRIIYSWWKYPNLNNHNVYLAHFSTPHSVIVFNKWRDAYSDPHYWSWEKNVIFITR